MHGKMYQAPKVTTRKGGETMKVKPCERPVQIQVKEETWKILKIYGATEGKTANRLIAELADDLADKVRERVAALL